MQARFRTIGRLLPIIYLTFAFPVVLVQVFATPPFQVADEENHFMRALQIADGHLIARRLSDTAAGGDLDSAAVYAAHTFDDLKFHPENKLRAGLFDRIANLQWGVAGKAPASFGNTAIYPAFFYVPASLGIKLGKISGLSILESFYLGRLFTAVCATFLAGLAIAVCAKGRAVLFVILSFPMVLSLFGSVSQDALSLAAGALVVAIWSHYLDRNTDIPLGPRCCAALMLGAIVAARMPLIPLFGLMFVPTSAERRPFSRSWLSRKDLISCIVGLVPFGFGALGASASKVAFKPDLGVSPAEQLGFLLHHPDAALRVGLLTLENSGADYLREMVGVLGWLDTVFSPFYYGWVAVFLVLALGVECLAPARALSGLSRLAQCCFVIAAVAGVFGALYLAWTPVGGSAVEGVQGRYLLVPAMFLILALPNLTPPGYAAGFQIERRAAITAVARCAICLVVAVFNLWMVPITIVHRYFG